jgi:hypothetical protein
MAQDALLSLALGSSSALRPSKSRRLTSLPRVAPAVSPRLFTASTISGSGLFQAESGWMPISAPLPTDDNTGALVKTSASGPMPTSRYCDHRPCSISTCLICMACGEPGFTVRRFSPISPTTCLRTSFGPRRISPRLLFDDALDQARSKGHARRFDDLQIAGRKQKRLLRIEAFHARCCRPVPRRRQSFFHAPL